MKTLFTLLIAALFSITTAYSQSKYGIDRSNGIFVIDDATDPGEISGPYTVSGIANGQTLIQFDFSPTDGLLYGLAFDDNKYQAQLYRIDIVANSYSAMPVGAPKRMYLGNTSSVAFDFNPAWDNMIMISGENGYNNYLLDAETGNLLELSGIMATARVGNVTTENSADILLYPNPLKSQARVTLPAPSLYSVYVDIVDLRGQIVRSYNYAPGSYLLDLDVSTVPTGLYNVRVIERDKGIRNIKVVKEE